MEEGLFIFFSLPAILFLLSIFLRNTLFAFTSGALFLVVGICIVTGTLPVYTLDLTTVRMIGVAVCGLGMYVTIMSGLNFSE